MRGVVRGLEVHEGRVAANLAEELPFLAGERLMMEAAKLGRDRQDVHEAIRHHARAASERMRAEGTPNDLMERLADEPLLKDVDLEDALDPAAHVGLAVEQTERFLADVVDPLREQHEDDDGEDGDDSGPRV
jgi:adenylosuccinate lyase